MKKLYLIILFMVLMHSVSWGYGIVTNSATRDTIGINCNPLDSLGNPINLVAGDSLWLIVFFPGGVVAYLDSADWTGAPILRLGAPNTPCSSYIWSDQIADIDGAGVDGLYTYHLLVNDASLSLNTQYKGHFQIINSTLEGLLDSAAFAQKAVDSLADVLDSLETISVWLQDSLYALADSIHVKWADRTGFDPATESTIVDVSSADAGLIPAISDTVWDEVLTGATHNINNSAGKRLRAVASDIISSGTAQVSGTPTDPGTYIILAAAESQADDFYNGHIVKLIAGTGIAQQRTIEDYTGATDSVALHIGDDWTTDPDATSDYEIIGGHAVEVNHIHDAAIDAVSHGTWGHADTGWAANTMGDQLTDQTDTANAILDTLQLWDTKWDSVLAAMADANMAKKIWDTDIEGKLKSLVVSNADGDAVQFTSTGSDGDGFQAFGDGTGNGMHLSATSSGNGILIQGAGAGKGANIIGGASNGDALFLNSQGTGVDLELGASGTISDGTNTVFMTNNYEDLFDEISIGCIVEDSTGNTTTMLQTNLAEVTDNHYNGAMVMFIDGTEARTWRRITDYDGGNGYIVFDPAVLTAPAAGDSMRIMPWASVSATATISDADMGAISDSVWLKDTTGLLDAGFYGLEATTGAAANISDAAMGGIADSVWDKIYADAIAVAGGAGDSLFTKLNDLRAYSDTMIYGHCVWVDAGANTNTVVGVDGTSKNPVGTIAAAKTIADALGIMTICLLNGANETIGETMEHYRFTGLTRSAIINLGGQDVDNCFFENITVTGEQGGTETIIIMNAGLSNADSLELYAINCAIIGDLSLRAGDNFFDKCYSSVAGNSTPVLNFKDVNTTVNVSWRHYSGGLELQNMTTDHTISYESDGQLIINANCDNGNVTARGMMSLTDNGASMNITDDAVWNRTDISDSVLAALADARIGAKVWDRVANRAMVEDSAGNTTTMIQTSLTEATDNHFNDMAILFYTGAESGQMRRIDDFVGATGVVTWSAALTGIPSASDSFMVFPWTTTKADNLQSGPDTITYYTSDTSDPDVHVSDVSVWMKTMSGQDYGGTQLTNTSGFIQLLGFTDDTLLIYARKLGYVWESPDTLVFAAQGSDSIMGYNVITGGSGGDSTIRIYGYAKDGASNLKQGVIPTATLVDRGFAVDTCNDIPIVQKIVTGTTSNSAGLWEIYLLKSKCVKKQGIWEVKLRYKTYDEQIYRDTIPGDSTSYQIKGRRFGD